MGKQWVKLYKNMTESVTWSRGSEHFYLFTWLLLNANTSPGFYLGYTIEPGQLPTSIEQVARAIGWSRGKVRHHLGLMEKDGVVQTVERANRFTLITIIDWDAYQGDSEA
jgi:biotin operon repressor